MAILMITAEYPPLEGGIGDYTRLLALALLAQGQAVAILTSAAAPGLPGDPLEVYPLIRRWGWGCLRTITCFVRDHRPEILHVQYQTGAYHMHPAIHFLPDLLRCLPSPPYLVVTMHDLRVPYLFPKAGRARSWVVAHLLRGSDQVVVTNGGDWVRLGADLSALPFPPPFLASRRGEASSPTLLRPLSPHTLRRPPALIPLASSLPTDLPGYDGRPWRTRLGIPLEAPLLGHFGLLHPSKGADLLVRALARLPQAHLLFVGGGTGATDPGNAPFAAALRDEIVHLGLAHKVHWTGRCPAGEAAAYLRACDVIAMPFRDGASFRRSSLVAALALGCAVVTTTPRDPAEVWLGEGQPTLTDGENATLVPPDEAPLAAALARLLQDPAGRARLAEGAARLGQAFTWEKVGGRTRELFELLRPRKLPVR
jgi:glycosyltransferase involved in cell wall biosynthesis